MVDLSLAAIPLYFASMGAEAAWHRRNRPTERSVGAPAEQSVEVETSSAGDYERKDTLTSLTMGVGSLLVPYATKPLMKQFELGKGRWVRPALAATAAAALTTVAADAVMKAAGSDAGEAVDTDKDCPRGDAGDAVGQRATRRARIRRFAKRVGGSAAVATITGTGAVVAGTFANRTMAHRLWRRRVLPDWGDGPGAALAAVFAWDAIYYWNHRLSHEVRFLWAIHVVHHSSEHYNLSTALRQPVSESFGAFVPYGLMALLGVRPELIEQARAINLVYQYWIHTELIGRLGPLERVLNTPSHHRVHHGSNRRYLDRNHGSILIVWDRIFGTFEAEDEPVRYGLTRNIHTFNPLKVAAHEYLDMADDVARSSNWSDRIGFVVRGPGWAYARRAEMVGG